MILLFHYFIILLLFNLKYYINYINEKLFKLNNLKYLIISIN